MNPFGPYYPLVLDVVMRHAERMTELLVIRERITPTSAAEYAWVAGRGAELRRVAEVLGRDWHDGRLSAGEAAVELARHVRETHEGLADYLRIDRPSCCQVGFPSLAFTRRSVERRRRAMTPPA